ncbi:MAG: site-specific integrase [Planctomycetes bacterium]|nr:site-specific integrase [Planctomycetota bacterium]
MAKHRLRFTKAALEKLPAPGEGRVYHYDETTPGLALCITANGVRTFYVVRRIKGRPKRIRIGRFPEVTIEQARKKAAKHSGAIADGIDPTADHRGLTCEELFAYWLDHAKAHKKTWREDERQINKFLAGWKPQRAAAITRADVQKLHASIGRKSGPYQANRTLALVRAIWNKAATDYGFTGQNPAAGIHKYREESRDRFLQADELPRFFEALTSEPDPTMRDFFTLSLLIGARRGNIQAMRWDELNLAESWWRIPESKSGQSVFVHLPPAAVALLRERAEVANGSPWVFPARSRTGHLVEPKTAWARLLDRAGIDDLRIHDLRRTLGSWQAINGSSLTIIGKSLGHKSLGSTSVYARLTLAPVVESVNKAADAILAASKVKGGDDGKEA